MKSAILTLLICHAGGPGTSEQAQPVLEQFLRHVEQQASWAKGKLAGSYQTQLAACEARADKDKPALVLADLPTYLRQRRSWKLSPLAHLGAADANRYYLLVRRGSYKTVSALQGKVLMTSVTDTAFIDRMILAGRLSVKQLQLKPVKRPLKALRKLARGKVDAALVDEAAYRYLDQLKLDTPLEVIHRSTPLPGLTLAASGAAAKDKEMVQGLHRALPKLCTAGGAELCKTFGVTAFEKAKPASYKLLHKRYR